MRRSRTPARRVLLTCGAAVLWLGGCTQILGDISVEPPPVDEGTGSVQPQPVCEPGEQRCEGLAFRECKPTGSGWDTRALCGSAALCTASGCVEPACLVNELRCADDDPRLLQICNDDLTGWLTVDTCESAGQCNASAGRCTELPCSTSEQQCSGGELQRCDPVNATWALREDCTTSAQCDATLASCVAASVRCTVEDRECAFGYAQRCKLSRDGFVDSEACVNSANCNKSEGCTAPRCTPGSFRCSGAELEQCTLNRIWAAAARCIGPAYCNATLEACTPAPCSPGARQCSGADWQRCVAAAGASDWETTDSCAAPSLCDAERGCTPPTCDVGEYRCTGQNLERCSINQNGWVPVQSCNNAALCNAPAKRCDWARCVPGAFRCDARGTLSRCSDDATGYVVQQECGSGAACDALSGACRAPTDVQSCTSGELRCNGQWLERCRGTPAVWRAESRCESAALCSVPAQRCETPSCAAGEYRCTPQADPTGGSSTALEVCSPGRDGFVLAETCSAAQVCDAVHGQCDDCQPLTQGCRDGSRGLCSNDGQEFEVEEVCTGGCTLVTSGSQVSARCEGS
jgi:hypothetical protein